MARYDKYDPFSGGFRAPLAADWADADVAQVRGVGLDASGRVVKGAGQSGVRGVLVVDGKGKKAGDIVDVMTSGEIVDVAGLAAGTRYVANTGTGVLATATGTEVGITVEAARLIVRVNGQAVA
jgi:hypothetical protein